MIKDNYDLLGVSEYATDMELQEAYFNLRKKYLDERCLEGERGNEATKKLTELDNAYQEILTYRREHGTNTNASLYKQVDKAIRDNDLVKAQELLDSFNEMPAEWHYLQAVVYHKKNWVNDCKTQLEIAKNLDPNNKKYSDAYDRLIANANGNQNNQTNNHNGWDTNNTTGSMHGRYTNDYNNQQMGGSMCSDCCDVLICMQCMSCCCRR